MIKMKVVSFFLSFFLTHAFGAKNELAIEPCKLTPNAKVEVKESLNNVSERQRSAIISVKELKSSNDSL